MSSHNHIENCDAHKNKLVTSNSMRLWDNITIFFDILLYAFIEYCVIHVNRVHVKFFILHPSLSPPSLYSFISFSCFHSTGQNQGITRDAAKQTKTQISRNFQPQEQSLTCLLQYSTWHYRVVGCEGERRQREEIIIFVVCCVI
jgi:hypothetical protein